MKPEPHLLSLVRDRPERDLSSYVRELAQADAAHVAAAGEPHQRMVLQQIQSDVDGLERTIELLEYNLFSPMLLRADLDVWARVRGIRRNLLVTELQLTFACLRQQPAPYTNRGLVFDLAHEDSTQLHTRSVTYGDSWKRRGGTGAYMVGIRKWDRIQVALTKLGEREVPPVHRVPDLVRAVQLDDMGRPDGVYDDLKDFRRYLYLWEAERLRLLDEERG